MNDARRKFMARGERGATLVEYALIVALIVAVSLTAIQRVQSNGKGRLEASDDRISVGADNAYYPGVVTTTTVPAATTTTAPGTVGVRLAAAPTITIANEGSDWRVTVTFTLLDGSNNGVIGATMNGGWSNGGSGSNPITTCSTSTSAGKCTIQFTSIKDNVPSVTYTLSTITGGSFAWTPSGAGEGTVAVNCTPTLNSNCD